jgi:hypothetical protein
MPTKLGIFFLGIAVGGVTFMVTGFAFFLTVTQVQYATMQARATQAFIEANQTSTRAKNAPVLAQVGTRYELVLNTP